MKVKQRLAVTGLFAGLAISTVATAKYYSASIISYVVEEALIQKLPASTDPRLVRLRFDDLISKLPDRKARLERLLSMSQYLEKLQILEPQELDRLLEIDAATDSQVVRRNGDSPQPRDRSEP